MTVQFDDVEWPRRAGVSWGGRKAAHRAAAAGVALLVVPATVAASLTTGAPGEVVAATSATGATDSLVSVIVRESPTAGNAPEQLIERVGGAKDLPLDIIDGYSATVPADRVGDLAAVAGVSSVTPNAAVHLAGAGRVADPTTGAGSMFEIAQKVTGASEMWRRGITGKGVDVALIDSGVVPVDGLRARGKVTHGEDFSLERFDCTSGTCKDSPALHLDSYGHGTHMAGIIAGRDDAAGGDLRHGDSKNFLGMAPDARIVSVKVADAWGATDVAQVIAGIDWVVHNRQRDGLDIRVLNLSFGTDGVQDYVLDPLTYAAETAWHAGIVVVAAAGNQGYGSAKLNNPAHDPYLIAVGAADTHATNNIDDDTVPHWSSKGDGRRDPDLVAPGVSVLGLRDPGSFIDVTHPGARVQGRFFRGTGTSQAGAVVAGAAALLVQQRPSISPDQVKALLTRSARRLPKTPHAAQGAGLLDLERALRADSPTTRQTWPRATGAGSLEAARGTHHITVGGETLTGELTVDQLRSTLASGAWIHGTWIGHVWDGEQWVDATWNPSSWRSDAMLGRAWSGRAWSGRAWSGRAWSSVAWTSLQTEEDD